MEEVTTPLPPPAGCVATPTHPWNVLPGELMVNILSFLDVRTLVEIKPVSRQWQRLSTTAIDSKGIGTKQRKAFETNQELRDAVTRYCPLPQGDIDDETTTQQYCNREDAEEIAFTYGWPINKWDVSKIKNFSRVFDGDRRWNNETYELEFVDGVSFFNEDISEWDVSNAKKMYKMFTYAKKFNKTLSTWNVSNVTDMSRMFHRASLFDQNLSTWNVSNVIDMSCMFKGASLFNHDLSTWNVSNVTDMNHMFYCAEQFDQNLSTWDVSNVTDMSCMFFSC